MGAPGIAAGGAEGGSASRIRHGGLCGIVTEPAPSEGFSYAAPRATALPADRVRLPPQTPAAAQPPQPQPGPALPRPRRRGPCPVLRRPGPGPALPAVRLSLVRLGRDGAGAGSCPPQPAGLGAGETASASTSGPRALFLPGLLSPWEPTGERPAPWGPGCRLRDGDP